MCTTWTYTVNQVIYKNYEKYINHLRSYTHKLYKYDIPSWNTGYRFIKSPININILQYCTRKKFKEKTHSKKYIKYRSLKNYTPAILTEKLKNIVFPDYSTFTDVNEGYSDLIKKSTRSLMKLHQSRKCV